MIDHTHTELAPGIHRLEFVDGGKIFGYHVLEGATGPVLVDTGRADTPGSLYAPFLEERGRSLADVALAVITHADADHFGGNHALREASPGAVITCHRADRPNVESVERIMTEHYGRFEADHGLSYSDDVKDALRGMMGPDEPVDLTLRGGETIPLLDRSIEVVHAPGHTPGHLILYDRAHDLVLGADAFFGDGLYTHEGEPMQPPPYFDRGAYESTVGLVEALDPEILSFTHYDVMTGDEVRAFVDESRGFVDELARVVADTVETAGPVTLAEARDAVIERRGEFGNPTDMAIPVSAHLSALVTSGAARRIERDGLVAWESSG